MTECNVPSLDWVLEQRKDIRGNTGEIHTKSVV